MSKRVWWLVVFLGGLFLWPLTVQAGGWSLVSLHRLPTEIVANDPTTVEFSVLSHGVHGETGLTPSVTAVHLGSGQRLEVEAEPTKQAGVYQATLVFPAEGEWRWHIDPYGGTHDFPMPTLTVQEPPVAVAQASSGANPYLMLLTLPLVAVVTFIFSRGWPNSLGRWAIAGVCVVAIFVLGFWAMATPSAAQPEVETAAAVERSQAELGAALFVAKGCRQCHINLNAEGQTLYKIGPNLTEYQGSPEFLRLWLADPQAVRPNTVMPNLNLQEDEMEALIAFLSE